MSSPLGPVFDRFVRLSRPTPRSRTHPVQEHHIDLRPGAARREWTVELQPVTSVRREVERLAALRDAGNLSATLSHWTVGATRVHAQGALKMGEAQGLIRPDFAS